MSKLDVGVGDEFPLNEGDPDDRHIWPHHRHPHFRGHHRHRHHFRALPLLLILVGVAALVVAGKIPAIAAYAMIGLGVVVMLALIFFGARRYRRHFEQHTQ